MELYEKLIEIAERDQNLEIDPVDAKQMCDLVVKAQKELKEGSS